jgi:hypothetical protein
VPQKTREDLARERIRERAGKEHAQDDGLLDGYLFYPPARDKGHEIFLYVFEVGKLRHCPGS